MSKIEIEFDIKKIKPTPEDKFEAIDLMNKAQDYLLDSLFIMKSILENEDEEYDEIHKKRMDDFINKFKTTPK